MKNRLYTLGHKIENIRKCNVDHSWANEMNVNAWNEIKNGPMKSRIQKNEILKQRVDCVFVSFLKAVIDNLIFPVYLFCDPLQLWSQAFLCLATVFGKHKTDV